MSLTTQQHADTRHVFAVLATKAEEMPFGSLLVCAGNGLYGAVVIVLFAPAWWVLAMPLVTVACFGGWGVTARALRELERRGAREARVRSPLVVLKAASAVLGTVAAAISAAGLFLQILGSSWSH